MTRVKVALGLTAALVVAAIWTGHAQRGAPARFTGTSTTMDAKDLTIARRHFEPGARTAWHSHEKGQLIIVEQGRMRVQQRGQPMRELGVHETDYAGADIVHWHGAAPTQPAVQVNAGFGGVATWLEDVTDAQYQGRAQ